MKDRSNTPAGTTLSQADEALRRVLARPAEQGRSLPSETGARRRAMNVRKV